MTVDPRLIRQFSVASVPPGGESLSAAFLRMAEFVAGQVPDNEARAHALRHLLDARRAAMQGVMLGVSSLVVAYDDDDAG